jgi:hypothetical protein
LRGNDEGTLHRKSPPWRAVINGREARYQG